MFICFCGNCEGEMNRIFLTFVVAVLKSNTGWRWNTFDLPNILCRMERFWFAKFDITVWNSISFRYWSVRAIWDWFNFDGGKIRLVWFGLGSNTFKILNQLVLQLSLCFLNSSVLGTFRVVSQNSIVIFFNNTVSRKKRLINRPSCRLQLLQ